MAGLMHSSSVVSGVGKLPRVAGAPWIWLWACTLLLPSDAVMGGATDAAIAAVGVTGIRRRLN